MTRAVDNSPRPVPDSAELGVAPSPDWRSARHFAAWQLRAAFAFISLITITACETRAPASDQPPSPSVATGQAARIGPLPEARHGHRAHVIGNQLLVFGGFTRSANPKEERETWIQDLSTGAWRRGGMLAEDKAFFSSVVAEDAVFAIGGSIERYDLATDRWATVVTEGFPSSHFGAALIGRRIIAVGGYPIERSGVIAHDLDSGETQALPPPPGFEPGDHFHVVAALEGALHVIGGLIQRGGGLATSSQHWRLEAGGESWRRAAPAPHELFAKLAFWGVIDDRLYVFGSAGGALASAGLRYDPATDTWHELAPAPVVLVMPATVTFDGRLHVLGGLQASDASARIETLTYDPESDRWF